MKSFFRQYIILLTFLSFIVLIFVPQVSASTTEEIYQRVSSDIDVANAFLDKTNAVGDDGEAFLNVLQNEAPTLESHFDQSAIFYSTAESEAQDENLKIILNNLEQNVSGLSTSLKEMELAIENSDSNSFETAINNYDIHIDNLNTSIVDLDNHNGVVDYEPILAILFWISLVISSFLLISSRSKETLPAEKLRNQFEFALFKSSLWQFGGAAISYGWLLLTPPGGTYLMLWGIIAIGLIQFLRGLYSYLTEARPAIEKAKKFVQTKLDEILSSDEVKNANYEEKIEEIRNRKPIIAIGSN